VANLGVRERTHNDQPQLMVFSVCIKCLKSIAFECGCDHFKPCFLEAIIRGLKLRFLSPRLCIHHYQVTGQAGEQASAYDSF